MIAASCRPAPVAAPQVAPQAPKLAAPTALDPDARGAGYLDRVALQLMWGWSQFLEDCRVRLPATHPLNDMTRVAEVELTVDRQGAVALLMAPASGDADFDRAVRGVIADASPLAIPPPDVRSDDDRVHLRWRFARDRRQAGPATAAIVDVELPLADVVAARVGQGELARAAARIARAPTSDGARVPAARLLMAAVLREALGSADGVARRGAVTAIGRVRLTALAPDVRALINPSQDAELGRIAIETAAALADQGAVPLVAAALVADLRAEPRAVTADARALVLLGAGAAVTAALAPALDATPPNPAAIAALAVMPDPQHIAKLATWFAARDARTRASVCAALAAPGAPRGALVRGLRDPDAGVRAACATAAYVRVAAGLDAPDVATIHALHGLLHDRDDAVRAAAVSALATTAPTAAAGDPAPRVRAALATALATSAATGVDDILHALATDRDADVRTAAFAALGARAGIPPDLALAVPDDPSSRVRLAAAAGIADPAVLARLVDDPDPQAASAALVRQAAALGAAAALPGALARVEASPPASAERVRAALAWLLAP